MDDDSQTGSVRVLVVDDEAFVRTALSTMLGSLGYRIETVSSAAEATKAIDAFDPHVVLCDLELGDGPSGIDVVQYIERVCPWVATVILSSHRSALLVDPSASAIPKDTITLTKNDLTSAEQLRDAIESALVGDRYVLNPERTPTMVSADQADVLRLVAAGLDNQAIAAERGTKIRAVERMLERIYQALGIPESESPQSARALAIRGYRTSGIDVHRR